MISRRYFLRGLGAAIVLPLTAEELTPGLVGGAKLKVGILSDIHMKTGNGEQAVAHRRRLETAFRKFKEWNVDAVLIAGDFTDNGRREEFEETAILWRRVFPNDLNAAGEPVVKLFVTGNHDHHTDRSREEVAALWQELFNEPFTPLYTKTVKGYTFVGQHWPGAASGKRYLRAADLARQVKEKVAEVAATVPSDKPFFFFQHAHPRDTLNCDGKGWGHWDDFDRAAREALNPWPNAIAFSGHSHHPFADEQTIWQQEFTSVGTSSLSYLCIDGEFPERHDNYEDAKTPFNSPRVSLPGHEGMVMSVCDNCVVLEKFDFERLEKVTDDWVVEVPLAAGTDAKYSLARRRAESKAPVFSTHAYVETEVKDFVWASEDKEGRAEQHAGRALHVRFPVARFSGPLDKLIDYDVRILSAESGAVVARKLVLAEIYSRKFAEMSAVRTQTCIFDAAKLPAGQQLRATVAPRNCFFKAGTPVASAPFTI